MRPRVRLLPVLLTLLAGIGLSLATWHQLRRQERAAAVARFNRQAEARLLRFQDRLHRELAVVEGLKAFYDSSRHVDRQEFRVYTTGLLDKHRSINALEWLPRVAAADREALERRVVEEGISGFRITQRDGGRIVPVTRRETYYPVLYVEPMRGNERALGFDLGSEPTRRRLLERARLSGQVTASEVVWLVQDEERRAAVLLAAPVFAKGATGRKEADLQGHVLAVSRLADISRLAYSAKELQRPAGVDLYYYDATDPARASLLETHRSRARPAGGPLPALSLAQARSGVHRELEIPVAGRRWVAVARPVDLGRFVESGLGRGGLALGAGLLITCLLVLMIHLLVSRTATVENEVELRTQELRKLSEALSEGEARLKAIHDNAVDGMLTIDATGRILSVNPAVGQIFDREPEGLLGQNVRVLMPEPYRSEHDGYLRRYLETGEARIIGKGRQVEGLRSGGQTFPLDLAVSEMRHGPERLFLGLVRDVTALEEVKRAKDEFISTVSHELRTPLTSIMGSLSLIRGGLAGDLSEKALRMIDIAHKNSERLGRLINDILDIEKFASGRMKLSLQKLDLAALVEASIAENQGYAERHETRFELRVAPEQAMVEADPDRLKQVMSNLLSNAAKYSPAGRPVTVAVNELPSADPSRLRTRFRVSVSDEGPGIPEEFHDRLFERFVQVDASTTRETSGTGLGLAITRAIVELHGGEVGFESGDGPGSTFFFILPALVELEVEPPGGDAPAVLVVEDDVGVARLLEKILHQGGYRTAVAHDAAGARELLERELFVAVTLDLVLPDQHGLTLLRELRGMRKFEELPVVVVSGFASEAQAGVRGRTLGIDDWLEKPIDRERLLAALRRCIRKQEGLPRVLHVEDDADIQTAVARMTEGVCQLVPVRTLAEARRQLEEQAFDLVILDLALPDGRGESLLPLLHPADGPPTRVIVFSSASEGELPAQIEAVLDKSESSPGALLEMIRKGVERP